MLMSIGTVLLIVGDIADALKRFEQYRHEQKQLPPCREAGYALYGTCHLVMLERETIFDKFQRIYQAREAFTNSLGILLLYANCNKQISDVLEDLSTTYAMRVAEDTTYEKATMIKLIARKAYTCVHYVRAKDLVYMHMKAEAATMVSQPAKLRAIALHDIGLCQIRLSQLAEAEDTFTKSLRIVQSLRPEEHQGLQISSSKTCQPVNLCDVMLVSIVFVNLVKKSAWTK
ncbi:uncharacterized protein LOC134190715 isoform X2 [Corticium candelabrum]|uniref:uncharacterized protein LOC134190715 isoform X2 n=1 Tax=Corticium candelabrum TaxID=121492 RepID=UPI002E26C3B0|nr:uncharacterized protein LOC134190715 isoform X2 [Corticium candelabrum]